jgi:hypothetical protein
MVRTSRTGPVPPPDDGLVIEEEVPAPRGTPPKGSGTSGSAKETSGVFDPAKPIPVTRAGGYSSSTVQTLYDSYRDLLIVFDEMWGTQAGDNLSQQLVNGGYVSPGAKAKSTFLSGYKNLLEEAQRRDVPISAILNRFPLSTAGDIKPTGTGTGAGGAFRSETKSVTQYDPTNVTSIANAAYRSKLGRNATKEEKEILANILNKEQRKSPQVTVSEGMRSGTPIATAEGAVAGTGGTMSTTTTRGGIDTSEIAQQAAMEDEDYEETFNKVVAFDLMKRVLDRPV